MRHPFAELEKDEEINNLGENRIEEHEMGTVEISFPHANYQDPKSLTSMTGHGWICKVKVEFY